MKVLKNITGDAAVNTKEVTVRLNVNSTYASQECLPEKKYNEKQGTVCPWNGKLALPPPRPVARKMLLSEILMTAHNRIRSRHTTAHTVIH